MADAPAVNPADVFPRYGFSATEPGTPVVDSATGQVTCNSRFFESKAELDAAGGASVWSLTPARRRKPRRPRPGRQPPRPRMTKKNPARRSTAKESPMAAINETRAVSVTLEGGPMAPVFIPLCDLGAGQYPHSQSMHPDGDSACRPARSGRDAVRAWHAALGTPSEAVMLQASRSV